MCKVINTMVRQGFAFLLLPSLFILSPLSLAGQFKALLFTKTTEWHHKSINAGVTALEALSQRHHFDLEWHEDATHFNAEKLAEFDLIIFLSTTGNILNKKQQEAFQAFIRSGKGFVGIHSASDTEKEWEWYTQLVGHVFLIHPVIQTARMSVVNRQFPGLEYMPDDFLWTDEWYDFGKAKSPNLQYLLSVDESTYDAKTDWGHTQGNGMGEFHPVAWYHHFDGGRSFYTSLGHMPSTYSSTMFLEHIYGGIYWSATGKGLKTHSPKAKR